MSRNVCTDRNIVSNAASVSGVYSYYFMFTKACFAGLSSTSHFPQ